MSKIHLFMAAGMVVLMPGTAHAGGNKAANPPASFLREDLHKLWPIRRIALVSGKVCIRLVNRL